MFRFARCYAATVADARDLLIASVLCPDPVLYIDDRWLYAETDDLPPIVEIDLSKEGPRYLSEGEHLTIVASSYSTLLALQAKNLLNKTGISSEVIDLRVLNPFNPEIILKSVAKTGRLIVIDGGWQTCGVASEVIACVAEGLEPAKLKTAPMRITLPNAPAPTSHILEKFYYPNVDQIVKAAQSLLLN